MCRTRLELRFGERFAIDKSLRQVRNVVRDRRWNGTHGNRLYQRSGMLACASDIDPARAVRQIDTGLSA